MNPGKKHCRQPAGFHLLPWCGLMAGLLALGMTGCAHLTPWQSKPPSAAVNSSISFTLSNAPAAVSMEVLQAKVMRFADDYVAKVRQAADEFSAKVGTPEGRLMGLRLKLGQATAAYTDASGVNPVINTLDMLVLVTVTRMAMEDYGVEHYGDAMLPLLETQRRIETNAWTLAGGVLTVSQERELKGMIQEWRKKNPHQVYVGNLRFMEFASALGKLPSQAKVSPNSIFSLLYIDPFAGLDPTAAAIEESRQLGERFMYYAQRMPQLLAWQSEVVALELANQPESRQLLTNAQQLATAADTFANTARRLPQVINDQRQAAIQQVFDELATQGKQSRAMLVEARQTLTAGSDAANSINAAIKSLDAFVRYVSPPVTNATTLVSTNEHPFNVLDYGVAAGQIGRAASELNATLQTLNQTSPELEKLSRQASDHADRLLMRAFWLGLILVAVLIGGLAFVGRFWRAPGTGKKLSRDSSEPSS